MARSLSAERWLEPDSRAQRAARIQRLRTNSLNAEERWALKIGCPRPRAKGKGAGPRVGWVGSDYGGAGRVRSFWPAVECSNRGMNVVHADDTFPEPGSVDVLVVHRLIYPEQEKHFRAHRKAGALIVFDEDDEIDALPPGFDYGRYEGRERERYQGMLRVHRRLLRQADLVTVSTPRLVEKWGKVAKKVALVPNYLPAWLQRRPRAPGDVVRVGWAGIIGTHAHDLRWIAPYMKHVLRGSMFTHVGNGRETAELLRLWSWPKECFEGEYRLRPFYDLMSRAHIGLVPLAPDLRLNEAKSWLKALEYALLGIPSVVSDYPEQRAFVLDGETGYVAKDRAEFVEKTQELIHNRPLRARMADAAWERAKEFTLEARGDVWLNALDPVLASVTLHRT